MFSILLYYSHFLTLVLLASLWSREEQLKDIHQSTLVLLCLRVTGNVLRIGHCCPSGSSQTQVLEAGFLALSIQSGEFKWHVHKCYTFRNPYNGLTWAFHFGGIPQVYDVPFQSEPKHTYGWTPFPHSFQSHPDILNTKREVFSAHYTLSSWLFVPELLQPPLIATNINVKFCVTSNESRLC